MVIIEVVKQMAEGTTIWVKRSTAERLKSLGRKGETYDEIINRLIDEHEKMKKARLEKVDGR